MKISPPQGKPSFCYIIIVIQIVSTLLILGYLKWGTLKANQANNDSAMVNMLSSRLGQVQSDLFQIKYKLGLYPTTPKKK